MTKGEDLMIKGKCGHNHCSAISNAAWCDLNSKGDILKLNGNWPKCNCQKLITFTPSHFMLEGGSIKSKLQKVFRGTQAAWNKVPKPAINATAPFIGMAVSAKTKDPKVGQATTNVLKSISGGKTLSLTDMHSGAGLRLRVM